jgi:hypothetical protein
MVVPFMARDTYEDFPNYLELAQKHYAVVIFYRRCVIVLAALITAIFTFIDFDVWFICMVVILISLQIKQKFVSFENTTKYYAFKHKKKILL